MKVEPMDTSAPSDQTQAKRQMSERPLAIVAVSYNSADVLGGLLDSLKEGLEGVPFYEVIIVDNDSRDDSVAIAKSHGIGAKVISTGRNAGYAAGINAATALVDPASDLLVLNPDIRLGRGSIRKLLQSIQAGNVGVAVPQILHEDGSVAKSVRREPSLVTAWTDALMGTSVAARIGLGEIVESPTLYAQGGDVEWATGAALLVAGRARQAVGEWDESFFLYSEEVDYLQRIRAHGLKVVYVADAHATHKGGEYHDNAYLSGLMTSNRIRYFRRHHGPLATTAFRLSLAVGSAMRFGLSKGHRAAFKAAFLPARAIQ